MKTVLVWLLLLFSEIAFAECDLKVVSVRDGDTFDAITVTVLSPTVFVAERTGFRLLHVDTPERKDKKAWERARSYTESRILGRLVEVKLIDDVKKRDSFGRFLVDVFICESAGGRAHLNEELRQQGWLWRG